MSIQSIDLAGLPDRLRRELGQRVSPTKAHRGFAPKYSFGRHRGPAPRGANAASVMIALAPLPKGDWAIPLTLRPPQMSDHAGQVSLPGGRAERGESPWRTACREFSEELGCSSEPLQPLGTLSPIYVFASHHFVTPNVGFCAATPVIRANPEEVAQVIQLSVADLISDTIVDIGTVRRGIAEFEAPGFRVAEHFVWGATAMILAELRYVLLDILQSGPPNPHTVMT